MSQYASWSLQDQHHSIHPDHFRINVTVSILITRVLFNFYPVRVGITMNFLQHFPTCTCMYEHKSLQSLTMLSDTMTKQHCWWLNGYRTKLGNKQALFTLQYNQYIYCSFLTISPTRLKPFGSSSEGFLTFLVGYFLNNFYDIWQTNGRRALRRLKYLSQYHFVHHKHHVLWPTIVLTGRQEVTCAVAQTTVTRNRLFYYCWTAHCRGSNTDAE